MKEQDIEIRCIFSDLENISYEHIVYVDNNMPRKWLTAESRFKLEALFRTL